MQKAAYISGLLVFALVGAAVYQAAARPSTLSQSNSSIIEVRSELEALQLVEQARVELDQFEALLDAATTERPEARSGVEAPGPAARAGAGVRFGSHVAPISLIGEPAWSELAAYENLRDDRIAARRTESSPAAFAALPLLPVSSSFSGAGRGAVGIPVPPVIRPTPPERGQIRRSFRSGRILGNDAAPAIALVRLAYFALRNGYHGGVDTSLDDHIPSRNFSALPDRSRVLAAILPFSFSPSFLKATAFEISVTGQIYTARDSHIYIGDVA